MFIAYDTKSNRVNIDNATKGENYYCPCCGAELIVKKGLINQWHFAHKCKADCDEWYEMSEWHKSWQEKFPIRFREIALSNENEKHRADIKVGKLVVEFQKSPLSCENFLKRNHFYTNGNFLIWLFDIRDKDIVQYDYSWARNKYKYFFYEWKWAYKLDKFPIPKNVKLFFQTENNEIIAHVENHYNKGFKFFTGVPLSIEQFIDTLRGVYVKLKNDEDVNAFIEKRLQYFMNSLIEKELREKDFKRAKEELKNKLKVIEIISDIAEFAQNEDDGIDDELKFDENEEWFKEIVEYVQTNA